MQSARGFCPRSTMRVPKPDIIEHFGNADAVPQLPERCLSRKAGIVRCCLNRGLQKWPPPCRAASLRCCYSFYYIICFARVNGYFDDYYAVISSLLFTLFLCRFFSFHPSSLHPGIPAHLPSFSPIIPRAIPHNSKCRYGERGAAAVGAVLKPLGGNCAVLPKVYLKSKNAGYFHFSAAPQKKQRPAICQPLLTLL